MCLLYANIHSVCGVHVCSLHTYLPLPSITVQSTEHGKVDESVEMMKEAIVELEESLQKASKELGFMNQMIQKVNSATEKVPALLGYSLHRVNFRIRQGVSDWASVGITNV